MSPSRGALTAGAAVTAAAAVTLTVVLWPDSSDTAREAGATASPRASSAAPTPSPTRSYPLSRTPRTIPAVREHIPAHGPGWRPGKGSAVVIADGSKGLDDEGRLLAGELKIGYRGETPARAG
ncbi:beta-N-acetylglucosaminidase, partial [Streptomyces laculatispora]|nr:beta-N-acetylglucosaminidase [Streptomyces laculatispora]